MKKGIICFLKKNNEVLLLRTDFAEGLFWNGVSGVIEKGENPKQAAIRELKEEINVSVERSDLIHKGVVQARKDLELRVFVVERWNGTPESNETSIKKLQWFKVNDLPFDQMFQENNEWLPQLIQ